MIAQPKHDLVLGACYGDVRLLASALRRGANPNARYRGRAVLLWAVQERHVIAARALIRAGASVQRRDDHGVAPLGQAAAQGDVKMVELLLKSGARVNRLDACSTALHMACAYRRVAVVKVLLAHGADPLALDNEGRTPLWFTKIRTNRTDRAIQKLLNDASTNQGL